MEKIISQNDMVYLFRILLAIFAGGIIGYERQQRVKVAGLRTHILISMASALMMIISKYAFFDVLTEYAQFRISLDVSRVAAGIIAGMGIFSGGIVFIGKRGNVSGLTTAAGIWATIGIGMVIGAGMYAVGIGSVIMVEGVQFLLHHDLALYRHSVVVAVTFIFDDKDDYNNLLKKLEPYKAKFSSLRWDKESDNTAKLKCNIAFGTKVERDDIIDILNEIDEAKSFEML